jgi:sulfate permease, SulP family
MSTLQYATWAKRLFPVFGWKHLVTRQTVKTDLMSGLTVAVVVVPQAVAFASIAGMPPQYGLYAGMIPPIIAAFFGSSWHLMSGPTTAASIVLLTSLSVYAAPLSPEYVGLALTLTFMVGVFELGLGLARMGAVVNFISHSVVVGFTTGAAILIASKQLKNFFGVPIPRGGNLFDTLSAFVHQVPNTNLYILAVALVTLGAGLVVRKMFPKIPFLIAALLAGSFLGVALNMIFGSDVTTIETVGALPQTLPPISMPDFSLDTFKKLAPAALAMTLFALTEAVSIGRAIGIRSGQLVDGNQEFIGQGLSNIAGSFFSAYVATGSFNRSSLNYQAGAKTPISAMIAGFLEIFIVLAIAPLVAYLPTAAMAGILFIVAWGLIDFHEIKHIFSSNNSERSIFLLTFLSALFLDLEFAIMAGILLSLVLYLMRVSKPRIVTRVPDPTMPKRKFSTMVPGGRLQECPQLHIIRIDGNLFFGTVAYVREKFARMRQLPEQKHLAIVAQGISFVDIAGADVLANEAERRRAEGGGLYLINVKEGLWDSLEECGALDRIHPNHIFQSKSAALHGIFQKLDKDKCRVCQARIFGECAGVPYEGAEPLVQTVVRPPGGQTSKPVRLPKDNEVPAHA